MCRLEGTARRRKLYRAQDDKTKSFQYFYLPTVARFCFPSPWSVWIKQSRAFLCRGGSARTQSKALLLFLNLSITLQQDHEIGRRPSEAGGTMMEYSSLPVMVLSCPVSTQSWRLPPAQPSLKMVGGGWLSPDSAGDVLALICISSQSHRMRKNV